MRVEKKTKNIALFMFEIKIKKYKKRRNSLQANDIERN
jgi:hypothetical protein